MKLTKWILLAEDNAQTAELTTLAMNARRWACDVVVVPDGLEALDCLYHRGRFAGPEDRGQPALVLLDLKMPRMSGVEVLRHMKADERLKSIPAVMFSSSREETDLARCYGLGANAYVVKPVDFQEFSRAVRLIGEFWATVNEPSPDADTDTTRHTRLIAAA